MWVTDKMHLLVSNWLVSSAFALHKLQGNVTHTNEDFQFSTSLVRFKTALQLNVIFLQLKMKQQFRPLNCFVNDNGWWLTKSLRDLNCCHTALPTAMKTVVDGLSFEYRWLRRVTTYIPYVKEQPYKASSIKKMVPLCPQWVDYTEAAGRMEEQLSKLYKLKSV